MPRFGLEFVASPGLEHLAWYGRGPAETYSDRAFERVGVYRSTVGREWVEYSRPQENGNKTDVRWVELTNAQGLGLRAEGLPLLSVVARHVSVRRHRVGGVLHRPAWAPGDLSQPRHGADGRGRHRQLDEAGVPDGRRTASAAASLTRTRSACCLSRAGPARPATPPRDWIDPADGLPHHPPVGGGRAAQSLYFHQNAYTATGDKMVIEVPDGLATVDLEHARRRAHRLRARRTGRSWPGRAGRSST